MGSLITLSDSNFKEKVLQSDIPVLVDFWAEWCGPCKTIGPVIEELSGEYDGKINTGKINIDENPVIPTQYGIRSIPTLLLFKDGKVLEQMVGVKPKTEIKSMIDKHLNV